MTDQKKRSRAAGPSAGSTGSWQDLRQRAEARYAEAAPGTTEDGAVLSPEETRKTLHELRVHQIELELQNEELRRAQAELEASRARYFDLFDLAPVGYLTLSEKGLILEANLTAAALLGTERRALNGRPLSRFIVAQDQDIYYQHAKRLFADSQPQTCELRLLRQGAEPFHARLDAVLSREEGGAPICRCVVVDITERKQIEEALRESHARYELVLEGAGGGIWDWDVPNRRVHYSARWKQMRGYAANELSDSETEWRQNIHPEDAPRVMAAVREHFEGRTEIFEEEYRVQCKDGSYLWIQDRGKAVRDASGQVVRMAGSEIDLSERKQAEEEKEKLQAQLAQAQKMESVGRLAGGVAHDFNNMLGVILGHTEMALERVDPAQPLFADLQEVRTAAQRSADLTRQLLAFARKQTVAPRVIDLNKTVAGMLKMLQRLIGEDIDLAWLPGKNLGPVYVDPSQIDQILANLCVNARDAIAGVGKVTIETGAAAFDEAYCAAHAGFAPGDYVLMAVSDNGCGMDQETLGALFEPFFTTKEMGKGTGLGLATVYGVVKQNNGFINVYSEPGQGTTFKIYLPRHLAEADRPAEKKPDQPAGRGHETILLAEDEPELLELTTKLLKRESYTVLAASTPGEAIRLANEHAGEIHLLMTDVVMPEMNGRDLAGNLLSIYPGIKLLFTSGYTANVIAHHGVLDEGVNFIQKPFSMKDLAAKVRELLDRE